MKILMVNKFLYPNGGSETYMFKLSDYLSSHGHEIEYFGMEHPDRCVNNSINCYTDEMDFHNSSSVKKITMSLKTIYSKEARKKIGKVLDNFRPDIVHLNNINFQLTPAIIYEIKKRNIPIVQTVHDVQMACPNHKMYIEELSSTCQKCIDGKYINCVKNKCLHNSTMKSAIAAVESYYYHGRNTYNLVDCYICPSKFMADTIIKAGVDKSKIYVLHNFCEKHQNIPNKQTDKKYALYFGRLSVEKGIKTLIEVCKELPDIHFVFAGTGPLMDECRKIDNIEAVGFKTGNELKGLIRNAAFSITPSECYENCSMSIIESLSMGTPVIGSDIGGTPELIENNKTGLIFEAGNKSDLKRAIISLYKNSENTLKMRKNCIDSSNNTIEVYTDKLIALYEKQINQNRGKQ
ncbi:MAG: glycosyltransferase family 4 protein [Eubacterium sp.]|nr:glycosyltransferase family 4 protein [Eubacterium sp.]